MPADLQAFQNLLNQSNPNGLIAGVLGESNGRANWANRAPGKFSTSGPATDINAARQDARRSLYRDLSEPPNPFGGGSAPYLPGAMLPGYPGAAGNIGGLA